MQSTDFISFFPESYVRPNYHLYFMALNRVKMRIAVILCLTCKTLLYIVGAWLISTSKRKKEDPTCTFGK